MISITSEELNYLIFRYLNESGFTHSAFSLGYEAGINKSTIDGNLVPPGALVTFVQKGIQYLELEANLSNDDLDVDEDFQFLHPLDLITKDVDELQKIIKEKKESIQKDQPKGKEKEIIDNGQVHDRGPAMEKDKELVKTKDNEKQQKEKERDREKTEKEKDKAKGREKEKPFEDVCDVNHTGDKINGRLEATVTDGGPEPMDICPSLTSLPCEIPDSDVTVLQGHTSEVFACAWNPTGSLLASGSGDSTARIWTIDGPSSSNMENGPLNVVLRHFKGRTNEKSKDVTTLDWNAEGTLLATGSYDGQARIWSRDGELISTLNKHKGPIFSLKWNKKGDFLLSGSVDKTAIVWDVKTGDWKQQFEFHSAPALDVDYSSSWGSWVHCRGISKDDGSPVSIFSLSGSNANDGHLVAGRNGVKRLRTVRHPNILSFLHSTEAEVMDGPSTKVVIYIVTEPVMPLSEKIQELALEGSQRNEYYAWGLHRIAKAVSFLNNDCKLVHGNVCMASVVVTQTLDWKLHAFDVLSEFDGNNEASNGPMLQYEWLIGAQYKPMELLKSDWSTIRKSPPWALDSWGLGCLIYEIFSGVKLSRTEDLRGTAGIPKSLLQDYQRLLSSTPNRRLNPSKLLENSEYFQNKLVETIQFMEILNLKDSVEKDTFFRKLPNLAEQLPRQIVLKKLLPLVASALEFGSASAPALTALLKVGSWLSAEEYSLKVIPTIVKLFASNDRAIRVGLLQHIDQYGKSLSAQIIDEQVYPHIANGFSDTSAFLRELTLKSMLVLAPKLSQRTISGSLLKFLSKLQVDEEPAIRTNTTILLGNIASHLNEGTRKRVLINAFTVRALRDTFSPARGAGIMALCATSSSYDATEIATRILPNIVVLTIDPDSDVRWKAFQAIEQFLQLMKQYHEKTSNGDATNAAGTGISSAPGNTSLIGWAMGSLTLKGKPSEQSTVTPSSTGDLAASTISSAVSVMDGAKLAPVHVRSAPDLAEFSDHPPVSPTVADGWGELENGIHGEQDSDNDGWDDLEPLEEAKASTALANIQAAQKRPVTLPKQVSNSRPKSALKTNKADDDDDDLWGAVDPPPKSTSRSSTANASRAAAEDDPWGAIAAPVRKSSSMSLNLKSSSSADDDLWASIAAPPPTAGHKPLSVGRGRGTKPAALKLGAQRINRTSSGI